MPHHISWYIPDRVLHLRLIDEITLDDFQQINAEVEEHMREHGKRLAIVIDVNATRRVSYNVEQIRASQRYALDPSLDWILVVGNNKLLRLTMIVVFNLARAPLQLFQNLDEARAFLKRIQYIKEEHQSAG
ncbi:MAG TPA: STAS/SEC14 domain-containing protein [Phototrophicaceae bacterium]|nr:STAS/SEC14 domain-containing protein [Phototrophicaceae bacterium]